MSEKLLNRVKRLVSGAIYDGVEAVEASMPEAAMKEAIREVDRTIDELREELGKLAAERHIAGKRVQLSNDKVKELGKKVAAGLEAGREDLAQAAIERQLDLEAQIPVLKETQAEATKQIEQLNGYVEALRGRHAEMEAELDAFKMAKAQAAGDAVSVDGFGRTDRHEARVEKAEKAFDRVVKNATGVGPIGKSDRETVSKIVELESIERNSKIAARLETYRQKMADQTSKAG